MQKTPRYLLVIALVLLVLAVVLRWEAGRANRTNDVRLAAWGSGNLRASEAAYYGDRISGIIDAWIEMGQRAQRDQEGRPREPYDVFLVLDSGRRKLWIEERGQVLEEYHTELPARMTWTVFYDAGNGASLLSDIVRLKYRGNDLNRRFPETAWLAGQRAKEYLAFDLSGHTRGISHSHNSGPFRPTNPSPSPQQGVRYYSSILVSDAEYEQARLSWPDTGKEAAFGRGLPPPAIDENKAAWTNVRKKLYQAIEGQVNRAGFHLSVLRVQPGPDYSAAHALIHVDRQGIVPGLLGHGATFSSYLLIDNLGNDVWYAKTQIVRDPHLPPWPRKGPDPLKEMPLEFLVSAGPAVPSSDWQAWLEKGQEKQRQGIEPRAEWTATLANGVVVTFLGVCQYPSEGRQWWGPDGSPIDYAIYSPFYSDDRGLGNRRAFAFAWRVQQPDSTTFQNMSVARRFESGSSYHAGPCRDRYGVVVGEYESCTFGWSEGVTTLVVNTDINQQSPCSARFKNISLVPGTNPGFEIVLGEGEK